MRSQFAILLVVALVFGAVFWYPLFKNPCGIPLSYRIGDIDDRFGVSKDEVRMAAYDAEQLWENAVAKELFTYDDAEGSVVINLVYDDRQKNATDAHNLEEVLVETADLNDTLSADYEKLLREYEELKAQYQTRAAEYEEDLSQYNQEVTRWNEQGGAPEEAYAALSERKATLDAEQEKLNGFVKKLNGLVREMNMLSAQGNTVIEEYNEVAEEYFDRFGEDDTFTQGEYRRKVIDVYQFNDTAQLTLVLAHELGHAMSLGHVEGDTSIMYDMMKKQTLELGVREEDQAEFFAQCAVRDIPYVPFI